MSLPERLRELRNSKGLSQEELGKIFGLTKVAISGYENGQRKPDYELILRFVDFFFVNYRLFTR